jgi:hypothetical protein
MGHHGLRDFNMTNKTSKQPSLMNISVAFIVRPNVIHYPINISFQNHLKNLIEFSMKKIQNSKSPTMFSLKFSLPKRRKQKIIFDNVKGPHLVTSNNEKQ